MKVGVQHFQGCIFLDTYPFSFVKNDLPSKGFCYFSGVIGATVVDNYAIVDKSVWYYLANSFQNQRQRFRTVFSSHHQINFPLLF